MNFCPSQEFRQLSPVQPETDAQQESNSEYDESNPDSSLTC